jgi:hypothetical protein
MITPHDLSMLEVPFTKKEIDEVVHNMPNDKAPGPDGFNGKVMKKYWHIMKHQFYELCFSFYSGNLDIHSLNTAYITLIPKINSHETPSDFRPISLVSMALKIIKKLQANKLQKEIIPLIHQNQYGFIKTWTIQDCLVWAFEYLDICHKSKKEIVIIKLDFEKAFDMVEFNDIIDMMRHMGFGNIWISWITKILTSASTSVILNGVPGKNIICKRGVKQGDPLSPLLFDAAAELLQIVVNNAWHEGHI